MSEKSGAVKRKENNTETENKTETEQIELTEQTEQTETEAPITVDKWDRGAVKLAIDEQVEALVEDVYNVKLDHRVYDFKLLLASFAVVVCVGTYIYTYMYK